MYTFVHNLNDRRHARTRANIRMRNLLSNVAYIRFASALSRTSTNMNII